MCWLVCVCVGFDMMFHPDLIVSGNTQYGPGFRVVVATPRTRKSSGLTRLATAASSWHRHVQLTARCDEGDCSSGTPHVPRVLASIPRQYNTFDAYTIRRYRSCCARFGPSASVSAMVMLHVRGGVVSMSGYG